MLPMERDDQLNDGARLRRELGVPARPAFRDEPPPRPPDTGEIRALHLRRLGEARSEEIERLILSYREWHEADLAVLIELGREAGAGVAAGDAKEEQQSGRRKQEGFQQ